MNTIIEKIRAEIELRKKQMVGASYPSVIRRTRISELSIVLDILDDIQERTNNPITFTLQEQPVCEGLEEIAEVLAEQHGFVKNPNCKPAKYSWSAVRDVFIEGVIAGASWQKEQMISALKNDGELPTEFIDKFHEIDRTAFQNGQANMRENMMKEAVEGEVVTTNKYTSVRYLSRYGTFRYFYGIGGGFQKGDKVKLIIVKED